MVAGSSIEMQSHKTFPLGVQTTSARWRIANCGCIPMPITPGSYWRYELKCPAVRAARVVQVCPRGGTYCRSSSQITHCRGATLLGGYWVPQAVQMNASLSLFREHALLCTLIIDQTENEKWGRLAKKGDRGGEVGDEAFTPSAFAGTCGNRSTAKPDRWLVMEHGIEREREALHRGCLCGQVRYEVEGEPLYA